MNRYLIILSSIIMFALTPETIRSQEIKDSTSIVPCASGKLHPAVAHSLNTYFKDMKSSVKDYPADEIAKQRQQDSSFPKADLRTVKITRDSLLIEVFDVDHQKEAPVIIYYHPGGFVTPLLPWMDMMAWQISKTYHAVVFAVDYRVAPKHPYPAATNDCYAAFEWVAEHAPAYGGDPNKIILYGQSAGATLAAVTAQKATNAGKGGIIKLQILDAPNTDDQENAKLYVSRKQNATGYLLTETEIKTVMNLYSPGAKPDNFEVSPIQAKDVSRLPPTIIITTEFDPFRDEGAAYAEKLRRGGVRTWYKCFPGLIHCLIGLPQDAPQRKEYTDLLNNAMKVTGIK